MLTNLVANLGLVECVKALLCLPLPLYRLWAGMVQLLAVDSTHCSRLCHSASAVLHGWERQDSRADFSVFSCTGEGSICQHTSALQHLKAVDSLFITARRTACFGKDMFCVGLCLHDWITDCSEINLNRWPIVMQKHFTKKYICCNSLFSSKI